MRPAAIILRELALSRHSDGELLGQFLSDRSESAFLELIRRHGPLVWSACRRLLPDPADAEDAFQAAFLVLVRHARKLSASATVGPWLYKVAVWTARNARRKNARRLSRQHPLPEQLATPSSDADLRADLDAALLALPARYRDSIVLCHLQGFSRAEAAARLGCAEGTLSAWLSRGLAKLRSRLQNLDPTAVLTCGAAVPAALAATTAQAAASTSLAGAAVPPAVSYLVEGVLHMFWVKKASAAAFAVCTVFALGVGAGLGTRPGSGGAGAQEKGPLVPDGVPPDPQPKRGPEERPDGGRGGNDADPVKAAAELRFVEQRLELARQELKQVEDRPEGAAGEVVAEALRSQIAKYEARRAELLKKAAALNAKPEAPQPPGPPPATALDKRIADLEAVFQAKDEEHVKLARAAETALAQAELADMAARRMKAAGQQLTPPQAADLEAAVQKAARLQREVAHSADQLQALRNELEQARHAKRVAGRTPLENELAAVEEQLERTRAALKELEDKFDNPRIRDVGPNGLVVMEALRERGARLDAQRVELAKKVAAQKPAAPGWAINVRIVRTAQGIEYVVEERRDDPRLSDQPGTVRTDDPWALALLLQHAKADPNGPRELRVVAPEGTTDAQIRTVLTACKSAGFVPLTLERTVPVRPVRVNPRDPEPKTKVVIASLALRTARDLDDYLRGLTGSEPKGP